MPHREYGGEPLVAVYKLKRRCPICGGPDWCGMNSKVVVCMRTPSNKPRSDGEGWVHYLLDDNLSREMAGLIPKLVNEKQEKAPPEVCERVYREFLRLLPLYNHHVKDLKRRGLNDAQIRRLQYRSLPVKGRHKICKELIRLGHSLNGVPGFMIKNGHYGEYWTFSGSSGYLVPVVQNRRLLGFQIRLDAPLQDRKYIWFSTNHRKGGAGSGSPFHVAVPPKINAHVDYMITEGALKADVAAEKLHVRVIGITGIGNHGGLIKFLAVKKVKEVVLAPDMDIKDNPNVLMHTVKLYGKLVKAGIYSYMTAWDVGKGKGIDDYVVNTGKEPVLFPASKILIRLMTRAINDKEMQETYSGQVEYFKKALSMIKPVDFKPTGGNSDNRRYKC